MKKIVISLLIAISSIHSSELCEGINALAFSLTKTIDPKENFVISPFSISSSLAMVATGASGKTFEQMAKVLNLPNNPYAVDDEFKAITGQLFNPSNRHVILKGANALFAQKSVLFSPLYQQRVVEAFKGDLRVADFKHDTEEARGLINEWVSKQTEGRIQNLFKPKQIDPLTQLVLVNALYLKAPFAEPFDITHTRQKPFQITQNKNVTVPFMYQKHAFPYYKNSTYSVVELPYEATGIRLSLWILLPNSDKLPLAPLNSELIDEIVKGFESKSVEIHLPKFRVKSDISLVKPLIEMGMDLPFSSKADFSLMIEHGQLSLDQAQHQAYFLVDESGSLAAAATGTTMIMKALPPTESVSFIADHPFHFVVFDKTNECILFMGQVIEP